MPTEILHAIRALRRRPTFTLTVIATLAIGLGASAAIFHVADAVMLRSLPFAEPDRLVEVWSTVERETVERRSFAYPDFAALREQSSSFEGLAAFDPAFFTVRGPERAERVRGALVSANYFELLGTRPHLGVGFQDRSRPAGDATADGAGVRQVILGHGFWESRFGGDPAALGQLLDLDGRAHEIVGVLPERFQPLIDGAELWTAFEELPARFLESRDSRWHSVLGRLAPGVSEEQARQELAVVFARLEQEFPDSNRHYSADLGPLATELLGAFRSPLLTLLAAVGLLLAVVCANVAALLRVHAARRSTETALRRALGASAWKLFRLQAAETLILGVVGGALGCALAVVLARTLVSSSPIELPVFVELGVGPRLVVFALLLSLLVAILLAVTSSLARLRAEAGASALRSGATRLRARLPGLTSLLVAQVALATVLAVGAGLLLSSFRELMRVEPGYETDRLGFARVGLPAEPRRDGVEETEEERAARTARRRAMRAQLLETASTLPGVRRAALTTDSPLEGGYSATVIAGEETPRQDGQPWDGAVRVYRHLVSPGYFETTGIPLLAGRDFESTDRDDSLPVAIVTTALAAKIWPGREAIGQRFKLGRPLEPGADPAEVEWVHVVGVVADHRHRTLVPAPDGPPEDPDLYFSMEQFDPGTVVVAVATAVDPAPLLPSLRASLEQVDRELAVYGAETIGERLGAETARSRFASSLLAAFAVVTLFLAALGIYGLVAYQVEASLRDLGVRLALGATRERVVGAVLGGAGRWLLLGTAIGLGVAVVAGRTLESQLYRVSPREPTVFVVTAVVLLASGLVAALVPSLRAGRVDPMDVLRAE